MLNAHLFIAICAICFCRIAAYDGVLHPRAALGRGNNDHQQQIRPPRSYVALGDSYAAGVGAGLYTPPQNNHTRKDNSDRDCRRQSGAYPAQFAQNVLAPASFNHLACAPDSLHDVLSLQVPEIPSDADLISVTAGTLDMYLDDVVTYCDVKYNFNYCETSLYLAQGSVSSLKPTGLRTAVWELLMGVRARAPDALVVVLGFARFLGRPVSECVTHQGAEIVRSYQKDNINKLILDANKVFMDVVNALDSAAGDSQSNDSQDAIDGTGFIFKSPDDFFTGHRYCDSEQWFVHYPAEAEKYDLWMEGYFHPLKVGQTAYKTLLVEAWLEGSRKRRGPRTTPA